MAESSTQSKTKRHKLPPKNDAELDRISDLPDSLLCLILSFLPTKEVIATSILSNRWKLLWTLVPKLDLDTETIDPSFTFEHIVSKVLSLQQKVSLRNFRLRFLFRCSSFVNYSYLHTWLLIAASRNVEELNLEIYFDWEALKWKPQKLPRSFLSCKSLVVLKLRGDIHIDFATDSSLSFQFPNLKILHLLYLFNLRECSSRLLSSCPVLEELVMRSGFICKIFVPTLKRLNITLREFEFYKLEINAPALEYFNFEGDLGDIKIQEKLDNLVEANVDIRRFVSEFWRDYRHEEYCHNDRIFQLLAELNNVKFLSFLFHGAECVRVGYIYPLSYQNLVRLEFKVNDCNWHVLQDLLQNAPNLEILDVTKSYDCLEHDLGWKEPPDDLDDLSSHLKSLCYRGFEGLESEVGF